MSFETERERMVEGQLKARGLRNPKLLEAFRHVPRHLFVLREYWPSAYADHPLPIGSGQTISQPYMVALMTSSLRLQGHERVLEIGAGSGYQTAILAHLCLEVCAVERHPELLENMQHKLHSLGYRNFRAKIGDGSRGWDEYSPYDAILVSGASPEVPEPLLAQLANDGRMVIPLGSKEQQMLVQVEKRGGQAHQTELAPCTFVPLIGEYGWPEDS